MAAEIAASLVLQNRRGRTLTLIFCSRPKRQSNVSEALVGAMMRCCARSAGDKGRHVWQDRREPRKQPAAPNRHAPRYTPESGRCPMRTATSMPSSMRFVSRSSSSTRPSRPDACVQELGQDRHHIDLLEQHGAVTVSVPVGVAYEPAAPASASLMSARMRRQSSR